MRYKDSDRVRLRSIIIRMNVNMAKSPAESSTIMTPKTIAIKMLISDESDSRRAGASIMQSKSKRNED